MFLLDACKLFRSLSQFVALKGIQYTVQWSLSLSLSLWLSVCLKQRWNCFKSYVFALFSLCVYVCVCVTRIAWNFQSSRKPLFLPFTVQAIYGTFFGVGACNTSTHTHFQPPSPSLHPHILIHTHTHSLSLPLTHTHTHTHTHTCAACYWEWLLCVCVCVCGVEGERERVEQRDGGRERKEGWGGVVYRKSSKNRDREQTFDTSRQNKCVNIYLFLYLQSWRTSWSTPYSRQPYVWTQIKSTKIVTEAV